MDASGACKYCGTSFAKLSFHPRRVTCGGYECKIKYMNEYQHTIRNRSDTDGGPNGPSRTWGTLVIPSKQDKLNEAMAGQIVHCPNCGECMAVRQDQQQRCHQCGALWTVSWGTKENGDVAVARLDRWS